DRASIRRQRDVAGLKRRGIAGHDRRKRGVDERLNPGHAAETRRQLGCPGAAVDEPPADVPIDPDVRASKAINRLLGIPDDEEPAWHRNDLAPVVFLGVLRREQQEDLGLQRVGVLELVDKNMREALLEAAADAGIAAHQVARLEQQIQKVERSGPGLQYFVARNRASELLLERS